MARPKEFDEAAVLRAAIQCFWANGFEATSVRDLSESMGITGASLYNAFGDKRGLYRKALERYVDQISTDRVRRLEPHLPPRAAIEAFFGEIIERSLGDPQRKGCLIVNSAAELAAHDPETREAIAGALIEIESFFRRCIERGQHEGTIARTYPAEDLARHLLGVLVGIRVLVRVRPDRKLLEGMLRPALAALRG